MTQRKQVPPGCYVGLYGEEDNYSAYIAATGRVFWEYFDFLPVGGRYNRIVNPERAITEGRFDIAGVVNIDIDVMFKQEGKRPDYMESVFKVKLLFHESWEAVLYVEHMVKRRGFNRRDIGLDDNVVEITNDG